MLIVKTLSLLLFAIAMGVIVAVPTTTVKPTTHASTIHTSVVTTVANSTGYNTTKIDVKLVIVENENENELDDDIPLDMTQTVQFALALLIMVVALTALGMLYFLCPDGWDVASLVDDDENYEGRSPRKEKATSRKKSPEKKSHAPVTADASKPSAIVVPLKKTTKAVPTSATPALKSTDFVAAASSIVNKATPSSKMASSTSAQGKRKK